MRASFRAIMDRLSKRGCQHKWETMDSERVLHISLFKPDYYVWIDHQRCELCGETQVRCGHDV